MTQNQPAANCQMSIPVTAVQSQTAMVWRAEMYDRSIISHYSRLITQNQAKVVPFLKEMLQQSDAK